jgi:hypothetical protein
METIETDALAAEVIDMGRRDIRSVGSQLGKSGVIEHDHDHVRSASLGLGRARRRDAGTVPMQADLPRHSHFVNLPWETGQRYSTMITTNRGRQ